MLAIFANIAYTHVRDRERVWEANSEKLFGGDVKMVKKTSWASLVGGRFIDFAFGPIPVKRMR